MSGMRFKREKEAAFTDENTEQKAISLQ